MAQSDLNPFPYSFIFSVNFDGVSGETDSAFQEVSGIKVNRNLMELKEGGENRFIHRLPEYGKYENLVLKRGKLIRSSQIAAWVQNTLESDFSQPIKPKNIRVTLMDKSLNKLMGWEFINAFPVGWNCSNLNAQENSIVVETLEFTYQYFKNGG